MHLTQHTDYALRVLLLLAADPDAPMDAPRIADAYGISLHHVRKVVHELGRLEYISTTRGRTGGIRLRMAPDRIRLGQVARDMEPNLTLVECFDKTHNTCPIIGACGVERALYAARDAFLAELDRHTLADMIRRPKAMLAMLSSPRPGTEQARPPE